MTHTIRFTGSHRHICLQFLLVCIFTLALQMSALAHELRPAIVSATIEKSGAIELRAAVNLEAWLAGVGGVHSDTAQSNQAPLYDRLRTNQPADLRQAAFKSHSLLIDGLKLTANGTPLALELRQIDIPPVGDTSLARTSTLILDGNLPAGTASLLWRVDERFGDTVIRVTRSGQDKPFYSSLLTAGQASPAIALEGTIEPSMVASLVQYAMIGFEHILPKGLDHILFVVGLFLLSPYVRPLLWQVTGFTLAHSVTLALGIYGVIAIPASIVEPLIAASIAFIAVENLFTDKLQRWRPGVVFGFGLLHGLGFAGVLSEIGLPQSQYTTALIGFNIGVEIGQLAVLAACFLGVGLWFRHRSWYRPAVSMPASAAVAIIAMFWFVERIA